MSNSRKKTKIRGVTTADSEKQDKRDSNRKLRRLTRQSIKAGKEDLPVKKEVSDNSSFDKDGKRYFSDMTDREMRK